MILANSGSDNQFFVTFLQFSLSLRRNKVTVAITWVVHYIMRLRRYARNDRNDYTLRPVE